MFTPRKYMTSIKTIRRKQSGPKKAKPLFRTSGPSVMKGANRTAFASGMPERFRTGP